MIITLGFKVRKLLSYSSASTIANPLSPFLYEAPPNTSKFPPTKTVGSNPVSISIFASIDVVVVLP